MTGGRMDGGDCNIPDAFLKKRGDNNIVCLLVFLKISATVNSQQY